jgi:DNA-directed RNA polymerase I, II, and III subunit RPABC2
MDTIKKNLNIEEMESLGDENLEEKNAGVAESDDEYIESGSDDGGGEGEEDDADSVVEGDEDEADSVVEGDEDEADSVVGGDEDADSVDDGEASNKKRTKSKNITMTPSELIQKFMEQDENIVDDDDDNEDYLSDEEYVKFDNEVRENQILNYHNDLIQSNFDEISALTKLVRNKDGIIVDPLHKTMPILTKFERARILGLRAKQLANGADPFIKVGGNLIQNHIIAEMELEQNVLPFIVCRPLPNGRKEYWKLQDLEQIDY